ncbi:GDP-mannose 4,6-dehydratase [Candidatus Bathyarchaeota archaeon]|nr:GDP-mannose 4,6-dehydratase [Candidatus Bathyarchaeota archaeon]
MKALVTGGYGFIGSHLVKRLIDLGWDVTVFDNLSKGQANSLPSVKDSGRVRLVVGDLLDARAIQDALVDRGLVFHLAANPEVRLGYKNTEVDFRQNIVATYNLLEAMRNSPLARSLVFTSTSTIYGDAGKVPTPEDYGPLMPVSLYGASKLACEALVSGYSSLFGFRAVIYRFANVVGPGGHGVVKDFVHKLQANKHELEVLGDGTQTKSYIYVDDCVGAMLHGLEQSVERVSVFNIGSEDQTSVREIAGMVVDEMGLRDVRMHYTGGVDGGRGWKGDVKNMLLDIEKIRKTGWRPKYNSAESIRRTVRSLLPQEIS